MLEVFSLSSCLLTSPLGLVLAWHVRAEIWGHHVARSPFLLHCSFRVLRPAQCIPHLPHCSARTFCLTLAQFGRVAGSYQILCPVGREDQSKWLLISNSWRSLNDELAKLFFYTVHFLLPIQPVVLIVLWIDLDAFPIHAVNIMDCVEETLFLVGVEGVGLRILLDSLCTLSWRI